MDYANQAFKLAQKNVEKEPYRLKELQGEASERPEGDVVTHPLPQLFKDLCDHQSALRQAGTTQNAVTATYNALYPLLIEYLQYELESVCKNLDALSKKIAADKDANDALKTAPMAALARIKQGLEAKQVKLDAFVAKHITGNQNPNHQQISAVTNAYLDEIGYGLTSQGMIHATWEADKITACIASKNSELSRIKDSAGPRVVDARNKLTTEIVELTQKQSSLLQDIGPRLVTYVNTYGIAREHTEAVKHYVLHVMQKAAAGAALGTAVGFVAGGAASFYVGGLGAIPAAIAGFFGGAVLGAAGAIYGAIKAKQTLWTLPGGAETKAIVETATKKAEEAQEQGNSSPTPKVK